MTSHLLPRLEVEGRDADPAAPWGRCEGLERVECVTQVSLKKRLSSSRPASRVARSGGQLIEGPASCACGRSSPVLTCWSYLCCCSGVYNLPMPPRRPCSCVRARRPCHGAAGVFGTHYSIAWAAHERCWCMASAGSAEKQFDWRESGERQQEEAFIQKQHFSLISRLFRRYVVGSTFKREAS